MDSLHWRHLLAKPSATATHDFTYLGHLGRHDGQGEYKWYDIAGIIVRDIAVNFANVNSA
jgi:hypothetical protein